jgi:hypothetical protein
MRFKATSSPQGFVADQYSTHGNFCFIDGNLILYPPIPRLFTRILQQVSVIWAHLDWRSALQHPSALPPAKGPGDF